MPIVLGFTIATHQMENVINVWVLSKISLILNVYRNYDWTKYVVTQSIIFDTINFFQKKVLIGPCSKIAQYHT